MVLMCTNGLLCPHKSECYLIVLGGDEWCMVCPKPHTSKGLNDVTHINKMLNETYKNVWK